jgi:superfamily II DNA or RNA helicase
VPTHIEIKRIELPLVVGSHYKTVHNQAVVKNDMLNGDITAWVPAQMDKGLQVVVLVREIEHGKLLAKLLSAFSHDCQFISGQEDTQVRVDALAAFNAGKIRCLIGTSILYQGIDTPNIDVLVLADLGKSKIAVLQALGRGLRKREGKERLLVRDYANFCHKWLTKHSLKRLQIYKSEKCFTMSIAP